LKCVECDQKAVSQESKLCKKHFLKYFEKTVFDTIEKYELITPGDNICVATSGGKDSLSVLYLVKKYCEKIDSKGKIVALAIDEGIRSYRKKTLEDLKLFCNTYFIDLKIISFERKFGKKLDQLLKSEKFSHLKPCNICGVLRRYLMNKYSKGYDKLITGHNLDDESQAIMMNFFRAQTEVQAKLGPVTGVKKNKLFTQRVKPLYFCSEKEVATYALLMGFGVGFTECPYVGESYRAQIRDLLNDLGSEVKKNVVHKFINNLEVIKSSVTIEGEVGKCDSCGEPAKREVCNACKLIGMIE
jgi:tRNA-5-methyluridine54 2-sulfurtransferase